MATFTVTTMADVVNAGDGVLSLREAVTQANATIAADTIEFAPLIEGQTLVLSGGELTVSHDLRVNGEGVTLDAAGSMINSRTRTRLTSSSSSESRSVRADAMVTRLIARRPMASAPIASATTLTTASAVAARAKATCDPTAEYEAS